MFADHHRRPDLRRGRRPHEVRRLAAVRRPLGHDRLLPGGALGVLVRRRHAPTVGGWIANDLKLARSTSPVARRCTSTPVPRPRARPRARQAPRLAARAHAPAQPAVRACSAPACCGSAGSASTPVRRWRANGIAGVAFINTMVATAAALLGWLLVEQIRDGKPTSLGAASGAVAGLVAITPACSSVVAPLGAIAIGAIAGVALCAGRRPEVPLRLRRLARRRRRPPRRRSRRHAADRLLRHRERQLRPASTACSTAAASTSCGARRSARSRCWSTPSSSR